MDSNHEKSQDPPSLLQLHIAEYDAINTKNTNRFSTQATLWPLLGILLTLVVQVWLGPEGSRLFPPELFAWGGALVVQIIVFFSYTFSVEQYRDIIYVEHELRPLVEDIVGRRPFWMYESWLKKQRGGREPFLWEYGTALVSLAAVILASSIRFHRAFSVWDVIGVAINVLLLLITAWTVRRAVSLRKSFFRSE